MKIPKLVKEVPSLLIPKKIRMLDTKKLLFINSCGLSIPNDTDYVKYFYKRYDRRKNQIKDIINKYNLFDKTCLSICSGLGQDEVLLSQNGNISVDCIEKDINSINIHKKMLKEFNIDNVNIYNVDMNDFNINKKYDIVFTSSPSNWMEEPMLMGIPSYFLGFVNSHSKIGTYFIARLYGANYADYIMKPFFISLLTKKLHNKSFTILDYDYLNSLSESMFVSLKVA